MNKTICSSLILIITMTCLMTFTSCGGPNEDPEKARSALEEAGFNVSITYKDDYSIPDGVETMIYAYSTTNP